MNTVYKSQVRGADRGDAGGSGSRVKRLTALALVFCVALVGGCASPRSLVVGQSTEADVRARMGTPTDTSVTPNGDRVWEYATGPEGYQTYGVRIGADGKVKEVAQLLSEDRLAMVITGQTTKSGVRRLFGRPGFEHMYLVGETWSWRYFRDGIQPGWIVVIFNPDGTVRDRYVDVDPPGDGRDK